MNGHYIGPAFDAYQIQNNNCTNIFFFCFVQRMDIFTDFGGTDICFQIQTHTHTHTLTPPLRSINILNSCSLGNFNF